jgi:hypothetical protein
MRKLAPELLYIVRMSQLGHINVKRLALRRMMQKRLEAQYAVNQAVLAG